MGLKSSARWCFKEGERTRMVAELEAKGQTRDAVPVRSSMEPLHSSKEIVFWDWEKVIEWRVTGSEPIGNIYIYLPSFLCSPSIDLERSLTVHSETGNNTKD